MEQSTEERPVKGSGQKHAEVFIDLTLSDSSDDDFLNLTVNDCDNGFSKVGEAMTPSASFVLGQEAEVYALGQEIKAADDSGYGGKPGDKGGVFVSPGTRVSVTPDFDMDREGATGLSFWPPNGDHVIDRQSDSALISNREDEIYGRELYTMGQAGSTLPNLPNTSNGSEAITGVNWLPLNSSDVGMTNNSMVCTGVGRTATNTNSSLFDTGKVYLKTEVCADMSSGTSCSTCYYSANVASHGKESAEKSICTVSGSQSCVDLSIVKEEPMDDSYMYDPALARRFGASVYGPSNYCKAWVKQEALPTLKCQAGTFMRGQKRTAAECEEPCSAEEDKSSLEITTAAGYSPLRERNQQAKSCQVATSSCEGYASNGTVQDSRIEFKEGLPFIKFSALIEDAETLNYHLVKMKQLTQGSQFGLMRFMCDFCRKVFQQKDSLICHLDKEIHMTGSIVLRQAPDSKNAELASHFIVAPACFKSRSWVPSRLVPVCPHCNEIFGDIMDCVAHSYQHSGPTGTFELHRVRNVRRFAAVKGAPVECNFCRAQMSSIEALVEHWKLTHWKHVTTSYIVYHCGCTKRCTLIKKDLEQVRKHMLCNEQGKKRRIRIMLVSHKRSTLAECLLPIFPITLLTVYRELVARLAYSKNSAASRPAHQLEKTKQYSLLEELGKIMVNHLTQGELTAAGKPDSQLLSKIQKLPKSQSSSAETVEENHENKSKKHKQS